MEKLSNYMLAFVAAAAILALTLVVLQYGLNASTPLVVVEGNSMLPTLYNGDLVLIQKPKPSNIRIGDIIVYKSPTTGKLVIHRVVKVIIENNSYSYITKGDNNPIDDVAQGLEPSKGIPYKDILGKVVTIKINGEKMPLRIPYLGLFTRVVRG